MPANFGRSVFQTTGYSVRVSADGRPEWKIGGITLDSGSLPINGTGSDLALLDSTIVHNGGAYLLLGTTMCRITLTATKTATITGGPSGGSFTYTVTTPNGTVATAQTATITYTSGLTAASVQAALAALSNVGSGNVTVTGSNGGASTAEIDTTTWTSPTAGDVVTITAGSLPPVQFTVNATATATSATTQAKEAWNGRADLAALGAATGTTTFIVTGATAGQALNITVSQQGTGTAANVVTAASKPYTIVFADSLGPVTATASGASLTGGSSPGVTVGSTAPGGNNGYFGPYDANATDGRQALHRGDCFVLDQTWLDTAVTAFPNQGTSHPPVIEGGLVDLKKLVLSTGQGSNSLPAGYPAGPTADNFKGAFPRIRFVND